LRNKKCPSRSHDQPDRTEALAHGTRGVLAAPFGFGLLRLDFRGSIEHVV
jgi:hypothetical protein